MLTYFYTLSAVRMDKFSQDGPMILLLTRLILVFQLVSVPTFNRKRIRPYQINYLFIIPSLSNFWPKAKKYLFSAHA